MNKLATAFGGLLMIGAVLAPVALAHGNTGAHALPAPGGYTAGTTTPSGFYYGSASAWAQLNAFSAGTVGPAPGCPTATGVAQVDALVCGLVVNLDPSFTLATADSLCDMEVAGDGSAPLPPDETQVDSTSGGSAPDGTFNDGGIGAVCHTPGTFYAYTAYNTPGCGTGAVHAKDLVSPSVWISATCDSTTPVSTDSLLTQVLSIESCAANDVLSGNALGVAGCVTYFTDCNGLTKAGTCTPSSSVTCAPDGVADASNDGPGTGSVSYPGLSGGCSGTDSSEATFVWNSVKVTVTPGGSVTPDVAFATTGWVQ